MTTFNHEKYIGQAIDSVLMQETDFRYELLIGEDCSQDQTRKIVNEYQEKYPHTIRALLPVQNMGLMGKNNFLQTLKACRGEYVATLDGDDYWTSPYKLQIQAAFLDENPDYSIVFHNVQVCKEHKLLNTFIGPDGRPSTLTICDLLRGNFIGSPSVMYRRHLLKEIPSEFSSLSVGDWPMNVLIAQHGKIRYEDEVMAVYRIHAGGVFSTLSSRYTYEELLKVCEFFQSYFGLRYKREIRWAKFRLLYSLALEYLHNEGRRSAATHVKRCLCYQPLYSEPLLRLKLLLRYCGPNLCRHVSRYLWSRRSSR